MTKTNKKSLSNNLPMPTALIERRIYIIRGREVMLDSDLAELYRVPTKSLNLAVNRNHERFPKDFIFQLTASEYQNLRFQFETSKVGRGGRRYLPKAFTEHGVAMLSSVLHSARAIQMNILIIRAFIKMRWLLVANNNLGERLDKVEDLQKLHHEVLTAMAQDIKKFKNPPTIKAIGFRTR